LFIKITSGSSPTPLTLYRREISSSLEYLSPAKSNVLQLFKRRLTYRELGIVLDGEARQSGCRKKERTRC